MPDNKVLIPLNQSELSQEILPYVEKFIPAACNELIFSLSPGHRPVRALANLIWGPIIHQGREINRCYRHSTPFMNLSRRTA